MRNRLLEAALDECQKLGVAYRYETTANRHVKLFIEGSSRIVLIGASHATYDMRVEKNVRRDINESVKLIKNRC